MTRSLGECRAREQEGLAEIGDLRHALCAARAVPVDGLDDEIAPTLDGNALQRLWCFDVAGPGNRDTTLCEAALQGQLVGSKFGGRERQAQSTQPLAHRRGCDRGVDNRDHAVDFADLAAEAFGRGGRFIRAIDVGDEAGIGNRDRRCLVVAIRNDHIVAHVLGALDRVDRVNSARDDEQRLCHQKSIRFI